MELRFKFSFLNTQSGDISVLRGEDSLLVKIMNLEPYNLVRYWLC